MLISLGPEITSDPVVVKGFLERFGVTAASPPRDDQVVEIMSNLSRLAGEGNVICDVGALVRALVNYVRLLNALSTVTPNTYTGR